MASRDNQTMQIFIIVLALVSLCLSVGLFMVNNARKTARAQEASAKDNEEAARKTANEKNNEATEYRAWIGYAEADTFQDLTTMFKDDMDRWGGNFPEPSYRKIVESMYEENRKLAQSEADAKAQSKTLQAQLFEVEKQKDAQIAQFEADANKAAEDKESLRNKFNDDRKKSDQEKSEIADQLAAKRDEIDKMVGDHNQAQEELLGKVKDLERVIEILKFKTATTDPFAQPEDGRISWVNQREGKVWINIGESDHLRPQVTFSVYSGDTNDVNAATTKGAIEVIRLLGANMAEARITDDRATRPLMVGDKVYSQVWSRGRQIGFAITGTVDLDDNGTDDLEQLERIVRLNNGKVDATPDGEGGIEGEMTVDTRYLILGKFPESNLETSAASRDSYQLMSGKADTLNIEVISLDDFLNVMGWRPEHRAVRYGADSRSEDFPPSPVRDYKPRTLNSSKDLFRPRKPQPTY